MQRQATLWLVPTAYVTALLAVVALTTLFYVALPPSPDQSIFDYIGFLGGRGVRYYAGAFDISWPGPFLYHEGGTRLFHVHTYTARLTDLLLLPIGLAGLYGFAAAAGYRLAGVAAVLLYPIIYVTSGGWLAGHRDIVAMHLLLCAAVLLMRVPRPVLRHLLAGLLIGYTTMLRPTYLFAALPFWLIEVGRQRETRIACTLQVGAGLIVVPITFAMAGLMLGSLDDWYQQAVLFPLTAYQVPESRLRLLSQLPLTLRELFAWPVLAAALAFPLWAWRRTDPTPTTAPRVRYFLALVTTVLVSYFVQNKGFGYHLAGLVPLFLLSIVMGIEAGVRAMRRDGILRHWQLAAPLVAASLLLVVGTASRFQRLLPAGSAIVHGDAAAYVAARGGLDAERQAAGDFIRTHTRPDDLIVQWGWNYETSYLSQRRSATRFLNTNLLSQIRPDDPVLTAWLDELSVELVPARVRMVVVDLTVLKLGVPLDHAHASRANATLLRLIRGYRPVFRSPNITVLERPPAI